MNETIFALFMILLLISQIKSEKIGDYNSIAENYDSSHENIAKPENLLLPSNSSNEVCFDISNQRGTCYSVSECKKLGGFPSTPCDRGLGACCIFSHSCHNITTNKVVYFKNPSYPQSDTKQQFCDLNVIIVDTDVCQLRLDFMEFRLDQPTHGECLGDKFSIFASGFSPTSIPILCGVNRDQHIYVSLPRASSDRTASIVFQTNNAGEYRWHIRITQIDCNRTSTTILINTETDNQKIAFLNESIYSLPAPQGCLQYYTSPIGTVESFNFGEYLNNLDYAICIERQPNTCRVIYSASDYQWSIDSTTNDNSLSAVGDNQCASDYLILPASSQTGDYQTYDRYCGGRLHYQTGNNSEAPVISKANGPIVLIFHSDNVYDSTGNVGFRLRYQQSSSDCWPLLSNFPYFGVNEPKPVNANLSQLQSNKN